MAFRGEDWVFDWQKYRDWERAHAGSEVLAGSQDAVVQLYRSYWLYVSPDHKDTVPVYAYSEQQELREPVPDTNNPYGVGGLFVGEGNERTWHYRSTNHVLGKVD